MNLTGHTKECAKARGEDCDCGADFQSEIPDHYWKDKEAAIRRDERERIRTGAALRVANAFPLLWREASLLALVEIAVDAVLDKEGKP